MSLKIAGITALVTGANRGIGEAIVDALIARGAARVYAAARAATDLAPLLARHGRKVVALELDVTKAAQISAAAARAPDVQLLVNNAGVAAHVGGAFTDSHWVSAGRQEMDVNFFGTLAMMQAFAPVLARNGGGAIVNIGSVASLVNFPLLLAYSARRVPRPHRHAHGRRHHPAEDLACRSLTGNRRGDRSGHRGYFPGSDEPGDGRCIPGQPKGPRTRSVRDGRRGLGVIRGSPLGLLAPTSAA